MKPMFKFEILKTSGIIVMPQAMTLYDFMTCLNSTMCDKYGTVHCLS